MSAVDDITDQGIAALRAIVTDGETRSAELRAQRERLKGLIAPLQRQFGQVNREIAELEGEEVARARLAIRKVSALRNDRLAGR